MIVYSFILYCTHVASIILLFLSSTYVASHNYCFCQVTYEVYSVNALRNFCLKALVRMSSQSHGIKGLLCVNYTGVCMHKLATVLFGRA